MQGAQIRSDWLKSTWQVYSIPAFSDWLFESVSGFPTQYQGLRYFHGTIKELALVATADANTGDQWRISKNGTTYAVYLVDTTDPNASGIRINTSTGIKSARLKT